MIATESNANGVADMRELPRMLVVDDENGPRQSLRMLLNESYEVEMAEEVDAALRILEDRPVDVIITDIRMPKRTGLDLLREVKQRYPDTQVIILTGYGQLDTAMEAVEGGAFAYVEKPFDNESMLEKVRACVERRRQDRHRRTMEYLALEANRFETMGQLVSGTLHDMATPLSIVGSHIEMLLRTPQQEDAVKRLETMKQQAQHCNDLVRNTMQFLRQHGEGATAFDLNNLVNACLEVARPYLSNKRVVTTLDLTPGLTESRGERVLVRQAILNLIYNGCQAMQDQRERRELRLESWEEPGRVCLAIEDTGPGISPEQRERIFDTLYTTKGAEGTGLGLTVVRDVMRRHGGEVCIEDNGETGARFVLRFPAAENT